MKKKVSSSSERISAVLLGGSICSNDNGSFKGSLFARKKSHKMRNFFIILFVLLATISMWEYDRLYNSMPHYAQKVANDIGLRAPASIPNGNIQNGAK